MNISDLVQIHHADYLEDVPFWIFLTECNDPILEIGCGHGRVAFPLLAEGREVVGVDNDIDAIQSLREALEEKEKGIHNRANFIHADIFNFQPEGSFGAVIIPCNTYSIFPMRGRRRILSKVSQYLDPEGVFAASMPNPVRVRFLYDELMEKTDQSGSDLEATFPHPDTGFPVQVSSRVIAKDKSLGWDWIYDHLHPDGQVERYVQSTEHYLTTLETYQQELIGAGFDEIRSMGDFDSSEYAEDSPYLILVAKKPGS